jgi:hypothetical protein
LKRDALVEARERRQVWLAQRPRSDRVLTPVISPSDIGREDIAKRVTKRQIAQWLLVKASPHPVHEIWPVVCFHGGKQQDVSDIAQRR